MNHTELLPCPFCGTKATVLDNLANDEIRVGCKNRMCSFRNVFVKTHEWNRRAQPAIPEGYTLVPIEPTHKEAEMVIRRLVEKYRVVQVGMLIEMAKTVREVMVESAQGGL